MASGTASRLPPRAPPRGDEGGQIGGTDPDVVEDAHVRELAPSAQPTDRLGAQAQAPRHLGGGEERTRPTPKGGEVGRRRRSRDPGRCPRGAPAGSGVCWHDSGIGPSITAKLGSNRVAKSLGFAATTWDGWTPPSSPS